jgi:hypothetical protein
MFRYPVATALQIALLASAACGAELTCFKSPIEASGYHFTKFGVEQAASAQKCDDTFRRWDPPLFEITTNVMAKAYETRPEIREFVKGSEQLANRLGISTDELFEIANQRTLPTLPKNVSPNFCLDLEKKLQARLSSADEIILWIDLAVEAEQERGNICK